MSHFMKTSGPSGLAKPRGPGAPCRRRSSALQDRDEDVRHRSHSRSQHMRYAIMSEIAEALAHVQLELTSLTKAVGSQLGGALAKRRSVLAFFQKLPPCLVGIEACASSHHWSRELQALGH